MKKLKKEYYLKCKSFSICTKLLMCTEWAWAWLLFVQLLRWFSRTNLFACGRKLHSIDGLVFGIPLCCMCVCLCVCILCRYSLPIEYMVAFDKTSGWLAVNFEWMVWIYSKQREYLGTVNTVDTWQGIEIQSTNAKDSILIFGVIGRSC